jgi:hypothetical protein
MFDMDPVAKATRGERGDSGFQTDAIEGIFQAAGIAFLLDQNAQRCLRERPVVSISGSLLF